jgi:hypothetical protein
MAIDNSIGRLFQGETNHQDHIIVWGFDYEGYLTGERWLEFVNKAKSFVHPEAVGAISQLVSRRTNPTHNEQIVMVLIKFVDKDNIPVSLKGMLFWGYLNESPTSMDLSAVGDWDEVLEAFHRSERNFETIEFENFDTG